MPASSDTSAPSTSLRTLAFLGIALVVALSLALIGGVGYVKYRLDQSEATLAAPSEVFDPSQEAYNRLDISLGYGGYLGAAQTYLNHKDPQALADMKQALNTASDVVHRLSDKAPAAVRHDMTGILALFQNVQDKAQQAPDTLSTTDLLPLASAIPMLEAKLQLAANQHKMEAQQSLKSWSTLLTLAAWGGLVLALGATVAFALALRGRRTLPLQTLAQSIENMIKGDLNTPIWGLDRTDTVGEVARAVDRARYRFGQMPDISVMTEQGPMRLKFEGKAKSLFEALTASIAQDHQKTHAIAGGLVDSMTKQKDLLISLVGRLNAALGEIQQSSMSSETSLRNMTHNIESASKHNHDLQQRLIDQIGKLVPYLQDRARDMADITSATSERATQTLQRLNGVESTLSGAATRSTQMIQQVAESANQMSERLFGALNILQASNNVLSETSDAMRSRFNEAVETLGHGEQTLQRVLGRAEERLKNTVNAEENMAALAARTENSAAQIDQSVRAIADRNRDLTDQISAATLRMDTILASFDGAQKSIGDALGQIRRDGGQLATLLQDLRTHNDQLLSSVSQNSQTNFASIQNLTEKAQALLQRLELQIEQQAQTVEGRIETIATQGGVISQQVQATTAALAQIVTALRMEQEKFTSVRSNLADNLDNLGARMESQVAASFGRTEKLATENYGKLSTLLDQMDQVMQRLNILGQLTGTLGTVAGQLGQMVPTLTADYGHAAAVTGGAQVSLPDAETLAALKTMHQDMRDAWQAVADKLDQSQPADIDTQALTDTLASVLQKPWAEVMDKLDKLAALGPMPEGTDSADMAALSDKLKEDIQQQWHEMMIQIEAMNDQLAQMVVQQKDQLETRLIVMDKKLKALPETPNDALQDGFKTPDMGQQTAIMNEIVAALANLSDHVEDLDSAVEALQEDRGDKQAEG